MKPIGSYIELQLTSTEEHYPDLIKLNTARNALEYILKVRGYTLLYLPYYTCDVMLEPLAKLDIPYKYYHIDKNLDPIIDFPIGETECLLYTNYFGIKQEMVNKLSKEIENLIVDNAQGFFSAPLPGIDTIYSCRKFFGVSDGAYLSLNCNTRLVLENDSSIDRFAFLLKRIEFGVEAGYKDYVDNDKSLINNPIRNMSPVTQRILAGIDYESCINTRNSNFLFLHSHLSHFNELTIEIENINSPLVYPLLLNSTGIKQKLIAQRIFVATYWPNVFNWTTADMFENYLAEHLIPIPIDHRYNQDDMKRIVDMLKELL